MRVSSRVRLAMVRSCCAHNCIARDLKSTREAGMQFYRFPQNEAKRTLLVNAVNRKSFRPNASKLICSQHFVGGRSDDALSPAYVPSIFSFTTPRRKRELEQGVGRFQVAKRRRENKPKRNPCVPSQHCFCWHPDRFDSRSFECFGE